MSLFAGVYSIQREKILEKDVIDGIIKSFPDSKDTEVIFSDSHFFLVKFDFGAFGEAGSLSDETSGIAALAGMPILYESLDESFSRTADLKSLSGYLAQGNIDSLKACHGTYALCHYIPSKHVLTLITDKLGSRPLYYHSDANFVYFSTCLKTLESIEHIPKRLNMKAFIEQHVFGVALGEKTSYLDIKVLRDGQYFRADNGHIGTSFYFRWDQILITQKSQATLLDECYTAFVSAIKSRSHNSQQAFSFLSGGLDSRCVVAILHSLGKDVTAFNSSLLNEQDQIFAEQYARRLGIQYIAAQRPTYAASTTDLFKEAIKTTGHKFHLQTYPQAVFSGDGGSVGLGFVYMDDALFDLLKKGDTAQAIRYFLRGWTQLPQKIFPPEKWNTFKEIPFQGMSSEIEELSSADPERLIYLFLLRNDQRRHLHGYYEDIDKHKVELLIPFYDSRVLETVMSAPTFRPFLYHDFYHQWLQYFPQKTVSTPWQTYPGHRPCPVPVQNTILSQWQKFKKNEFAIGKPWVKQCVKILGKKNFPDTEINRKQVVLALALHSLRIRNYSYIFKFCVNLYKYTGGVNRSWEKRDSSNLNQR